MASRIEKMAAELRVKTGKSVTLVDAKDDLNVVVKKCDTKNVKKYDANECVVSKALKRQHDVPEAHIYRTTAWVLQDREDGYEYVRYIISSAAQQCIRDFDSMGKWTGKLGRIYLKAPSGSATKERYTARSRKRLGDHGSKGRGSGSRSPLLSIGVDKGGVKSGKDAKVSGASVFSGAGKPATVAPRGPNFRLRSDGF